MTTNVADKPATDTIPPDHEATKPLDAWSDDLRASITDAMCSVTMVLSDVTGGLGDSTVDHPRLLASACSTLSMLLRDVDSFTCNLGWGVVPGVGQAMGAAHVQSIRGVAPKPAPFTPSTVARTVEDELSGIEDDVYVASAATSDTSLATMLERVAMRLKAARCKLVEIPAGGAS